MSVAVGTLPVLTWRWEWCADRITQMRSVILHEFQEISGKETSRWLSIRGCFLSRWNLRSNYQHDRLRTWRSTQFSLKVIEEWTALTKCVVYSQKKKQKYRRCKLFMQQLSSILERFWLVLACLRGVGFILVWKRQKTVATKIRSACFWSICKHKETRRTAFIDSV